MYPIIQGYLWTSSTHKVCAIFQLHRAMLSVLWSKRNQSMLLYTTFMYSILYGVYSFTLYI